MKYTIETMDTGCIEILTFQDGRRYYKRTEKTKYGCRALDASQKGNHGSRIHNSFCQSGR